MFPPLVTKAVPVVSTRFGVPFGLLSPTSGLLGPVVELKTFHC